MSNAALMETWRKYRGWAARARTIRAELDRWRLFVLRLTVAGALLATIASQLPAWFGSTDGVVLAARVLSALSAAAMAMAAYSGRSVLDPATERQWLRARALAESSRSECYRFATSVPPYNGEDAGARLLGRLQQLLASGADVPAMEVGEEDAAMGVPSHPMPVQDYVAQRIRGQIENFYRPRAAENERNAALYGRWSQALNAAAAVLGAVGAIWGGGYLEVWVAVVGTVAAAIGTYALGRRFQRLAATYQVTADRLAVRLALWEVTTMARSDPSADRSLVLDAEGIMAAENEAWLAEFLKDPAASGQAGER
jgi:SMODS and SLOG-associating 2TM effector domain 1/SMODS and SLOG-associating 2TM effector domain 3